MHCKQIDIAGMDASHLCHNSLCVTASHRLESQQHGLNNEWQTTQPTDNSAQVQDNSAQAELSRDNSAPVLDNSAGFQRQLGPDGNGCWVNYYNDDGYRETKPLHGYR